MSQLGPTEHRYVHSRFDVISTEHTDPAEARGEPADLAARRRPSSGWTRPERSRNRFASFYKLG
jgi:hypothetical protein